MYDKTLWVGGGLNKVYMCGGVSWECFKDEVREVGQLVKGAFKAYYTC